MSSDLNHSINRLDVREKGDAVFIYAHDTAAYLEFELLEAGIYDHRATSDKREKIDVAGQDVEGAGAVGGTQGDGLALVVSLKRAKNLDVETLLIFVH